MDAVDDAWHAEQVQKWREAVVRHAGTMPPTSEQESHEPDNKSEDA
jgi:hypothetical protein